MRDAAPSTGTAAVDADHMRRALALATQGWGQTAPNPMVGAVVVSGGAIVGEGYHARYGEAHAEVNALRAAAVRARGATLYLTLEPCAHFGKTPPCADAIVAAGISRVVVAVPDPSDVARGGIERLRAAGIRVDLGVERDAALELNAPFFAAHARSRPWVVLKLAISRDGGIADPAGVERWITGVESRREVHRLRANADAVAVGVGTVIADDPELAVRDAAAPRVAPLRVVFDSSARTPPSARVVATARTVPTMIVTTRVDASLPDPAGVARRLIELSARGVQVARAVSLGDALDQLFARGIRSLFVEGGARLAGSFLAEGLVDRVVIFRSSLILGPAALKAFAFAAPVSETSLERERVVETRRFGDDVMTVYALHEVPCSPD
jgi:diaminohydroxyphosphoribosylaminopyrimidine deaminase/5-amino-6-(5-phosphoribosylamino)uracil reductase